MKSPQPKTLPELETAARAEIKYGRYKEAIAIYKDLLKRERRPDWEAALAETYLSRARQVAGKSMHQEAALLWENHAKLRPGVGPSEEYLYWLGRAGQPAKLAQAAGVLPDAVARTPAGRQAVETVALMALENEKLLGQLPSEHAIVRQRPSLRQAIAAYRAGHDAEAEECLKGIPSRSPYRNARTLLKALLALPTDRAAAAALLDRVEADSVCRSFARALRQAVATDPPELEGYLQLPARQQAVINALNGYDKTRVNLLRDAQKAVAARAPKSLLETALKYRAELGETASRRFCQAALIAYPEGIPLFERAFGKLPPFEAHRIRALSLESEGDPATASRHWTRCIDELKQRPEGQREPLTQAAIHRHVARMAAGPAPEVAIEALEDSLALDPDDRQSYLLLISLHEELGDPKAAQAWLDELLKRFPRDPEALSMAMKAANRRKAFKKAAGYAKTLLEIDPINSQARKLLLDAHLGHARKQLKAGRVEAARKELEQARALDTQGRDPAPLFVAGLAACGEGNLVQGGKLLREARALAGGGVAAQFQFAMEILLAGQDLNALSRLASGPDKGYVADKPELLALVKSIGQYRHEGKPNLGAALRKLAPLLKKSFKQAELSEEDCFGLCQGFADAGLYDLVAECAKQGLRRSPFAPGLSYFEALAKCKGDAAKLKPRDAFRLHSAIQHAQRSGDRRAAALIGNFLRKFEESLPDEDEDYLDFDGFPMPPGMGIPEELAGIDPIKLVRFIEQITELETMGRQELIEFLSAGGQSPTRFKTMSEQQLFERAADKIIGELGIDRETLANLPIFGGKGKNR